MDCKIDNLSEAVRAAELEYFKDSEGVVQTERVLDEFICLFHELHWLGSDLAKIIRAVTFYAANSTDNKLEKEEVLKAFESVMSNETAIMNRECTLSVLADAFEKSLNNK